MLRLQSDERTETSHAVASGVMHKRYEGPGRCKELALFSKRCKHAVNFSTSTAVLIESQKVLSECHFLRGQ